MPIMLPRRSTAGMTASGLAERSHAAVAAPAAMAVIKTEDDHDLPRPLDAHAADLGSPKVARAVPVTVKRHSREVAAYALLLPRLIICAAELKCKQDRSRMPLLTPQHDLAQAGTCASTVRCHHGTGADHPTSFMMPYDGPEYHFEQQQNEILLLLNAFLQAKCNMDHLA